MCTRSTAKRVDRVTKSRVGDKMIVCGREATCTCRWWDIEIKERISLRREVYKEVIIGREDMWDEYCRSRKYIS